MIWFLLATIIKQGPLKKKNKSLTFLGDWISKFTVTMIDDNGVWQGNWKEFIDLS